MEAEDRLDRFLDDALKDGGAALPRMGLEQRILANLAAEPLAANKVWRWWWAMPVLAVIVLVMMLAIRKEPKPELRANAVPKAEEVEHAAKPAVPTIQAVHQQQPNLTAKKRQRVHRSQPEEPRLAKFPSDGDADEIRLLMQFVRRNPETAQELVREQEDFQTLAEQKLGGGD